MAQLDYKLLGQRIRKARQNKKMTLEALAEACGLSTAHIGHIERGTRIPSLDALYQLASVLQVSTDSLLLDSICDTRQVFTAISASLTGKSDAQVRKFTAAVKALADSIDAL